MQTLIDKEIDSVSGGEGLFYYVGYGAGRVIRELNDFGSWLGGEIYDALH